MLTSLILSLQSPTGAALPASLGRAGQALLLSLIRDRDPALAETIHAGEGTRPYTVSNLVLGRRKGGSLHIEAGQEGWLRFTGLTADLSAALQELVDHPPPEISLADHPFRVTGTTLDPARHPWAGRVSYQALAAPYLLGKQERLRAKIRLEFASPTSFKSQGRFVPLPLPELVFGSLLDRWQRFGPVELHPEMRRFAAEAVGLSRYRLRTRAAPYKQGGLHIGFTGQATFVALNRDRYWLSLLHLLADFAFYSGVGIQTAAGLGQLRRAE
jgi:CRISPR-associated endoribonuclease Cas6